MLQEILLRDATEADLPAIRDIYNDAVIHTTAIWNDAVIDVQNRQVWLEYRRAKGYPVIVAERDGVVAGYASYGDWRAFDGYRNTMEHSVYVEKSQRGGGIGRLLMSGLIERAQAAGVHVLVGCIEAENAGSIRLHESLGFRYVGRFEQVGQKFGRWLDLTAMELRLDQAPAPKSA